jgi:hypothetical protein
MKKYLSILIIGLSFNTVQSQNISDALRYSQDNLNGTARFRAMSGTFGALGGDLSSLNVNPAGSAVFTNNQVALTLNSYGTKNKSNYFGTKTTENNAVLDLNQAGSVFVFNNYDKKSDWKKFTIALNYENANNFDNSLYSAGTNPTNSVANYFLSYANPNPLTGQSGISLNTLENSYYEDLNFIEQQAFLGFHGYIIDPDDISNNTYTSNVPLGGNYYQENSFESAGYNGKLAFNAATQYKDQFYFGINLNSHFTDYRQSTSFHEDNANSQTDGVRSIDFNNDLHTYGTGFSFQLGAIAKATKEIRLGLTYESPTWYELNDELNQKLSSRGFNYGNPPNPELSYAIPDSDFIIIYAPYRLQTPSKWTGSFAYVFGKSGLISIDYALKDYANAQFKSQNKYRNANNEISSLLDQSGELRIGAEYKIKQWSLRGGYRFEQSPYKDKKIIDDLTGYSTGLGYNFGSTRLDLAYSYAQRDSQKQFFSRGLTDSAKINSVKNNVTITLAFEL